jgi:hypothetical protein
LKPTNFWGASEEKREAAVDSARRNNASRGDPGPGVILPSVTITPPTPPEKHRRKKTPSLSDREKKMAEKTQSRREHRDELNAQRRKHDQAAEKSVASTGSTGVSDQEIHHTAMRIEFNVSLASMEEILRNADGFIRASARAERSRLIDAFNNYNMAVHAYLEAIDEDGGSLEVYDHILEEYNADREIFEDRYKTVNDTLKASKTKVTPKERQERLMKKMLKEREDKENDEDRDIASCSTREINDIVQSSYIKIVGLVEWIVDYANHVLLPKQLLSNQQVVEVANDIEAKMAIAKKKEKMLMDYSNSADKTHCEIAGHVALLKERANATLEKVLSIRDSGEGVQNLVKVRSEIHVPPTQTTFNLNTSSSSQFPTMSRASSGVFRSDSCASTIAGPRGLAALTQARQQGLPTHSDQYNGQQFSNAQLIGMGCSGNATGSLTVDQNQRQRERTSRPGGLDLQNGSLGVFSAPDGNLTTDDPYATDNKPLCITDSVTKLLMSNPTQETNWSDIFTGKKDLLFWNAHVYKIKEDLSIPNKFSGTDLSLWCEFKAVVHANINTKQYLNWSEKTTALSRALAKPALDHCDFTDRSRLGYIMNLYILEKEYGAFKKQESALYMMLSTLPRMDNNKPETLHEPRMILRKLVKVVTQEGHTNGNAEDLFFDRAPWEPWARASFEAFVLARGESGETAELFDCWAKSCQNFHAQRVTRTNLAKINGPTTTLAVAEKPGTTTVPAACLNIIVDNDHYQSDEDDGVFRDYGDYACLATYSKPRPPPKCYDCGLDHTVRTCPKFNARTPEDNAKMGHEWTLPKMLWRKTQSYRVQDYKTLRGMRYSNRPSYDIAWSIYQGHLESGGQSHCETTSPGSITAAHGTAISAEPSTVPTAAVRATTLSTTISTTEDDVQAKQSHDNIGHICDTSTSATTPVVLRNATTNADSTAATNHRF